MQTLPKKPEKKPRKQFTNQNAVESLESIVGDFKKSLKEDVVKGTAKSAKDSFKDDLAKGAVNEAWDELLGINHDQATKGHEGVRLDQGELSEGAELDLEALKEETIEVTEMGRQFSSEVIHAGKKLKHNSLKKLKLGCRKFL